MTTEEIRERLRKEADRKIERERANEAIRRSFDAMDRGTRSIEVATVAIKTLLVIFGIAALVWRITK